MSAPHKKRIKKPDSDDWDKKIQAMKADWCFMEWLTNYLPDWELEYTGDLIGLYDAWLAALKSEHRVST